MLPPNIAPNYSGTVDQATGIKPLLETHTIDNVSLSNQS